MRSFDRIEASIREALAQELPISTLPPEIVYERPTADIERIVITFKSPYEVDVAANYVAPLEAINFDITIGGEAKE